jgi:tetratricopeptide (TPR) repeat protein
MSIEVLDRGAIFSNAIEIASPEERDAYIARACGGDAALRREVEEMVAAHFQAGTAAEKPPAAGDALHPGRDLERADGRAGPSPAPSGPQGGTRRYPRGLAIVALLLLAVAGGSAGLAVWEWREAEHAQAAAKEAVDERDHALQATAEVRKQYEQAEAAREAVAVGREQALATARAAQHSAEDTKAVLAFFLDKVLSAGRPKGWAGGLGKGVTLRGAVDAAEPEVAKAFADRPLAEALIREMLGATYQDLEAAALAVKQFERALALREAALGPAHADTTTCRNKLAVAYRLADHHPEASRLYHQNANSSTFAAALAVQGSVLLSQNKPAEAEQKLRECLTVRQKAQPDDWTTFDTQSMLGEALLEQKKYAEAEPLLLKGYEGMKKREAQVPAESRPRRTKALERLVRLYTAWGKKDNAARWQKVLEAAKTP